MTDVKIPKLGDGVDGADILSILVSVGDEIAEGDAILELESDKATVEVPSTASGVVKSISVSEGDTVSEGQVVLVLEGADATNTEDTAEKTEASTEETAELPTDNTPEDSSEDGSEDTSGESHDIEMKVPKLGDGVDGADVLSILVSEGDEISEGDAVLELESDKATVEIPASASGTIISIAVAEGDTLSEGQVIGVLSSSGGKSDSGGKSAAKSTAQKEKPASKAEHEAEPKSEAKPEKADAPSRPVAPQQELKPGTLVPAAPSVRRFARELGVDIQQVKGSGARGRISEADVKAHVKQAMQQGGSRPASAAPAATQANLPPMPDFSQFGDIKTEKMGAVRRATAQQMSLSWQNIPHVTQFDQADITELEAFRKGQTKIMDRAGAKLTVTAILMKICALALKKFPQFNASIDTVNQQIIYKKFYNIGVAVDTPRGLLVPVIKDVDKKGFIDLSKDLGEMAKKARDRKVSAEDMQGGTFTVSNLGGLGTTYFTPIVNWPQVAILGVGRASQQPVFKDGEFVPRMIMPLSISYDHRLIDGADAARFLRWIAVGLESPLMMMMESEIEE